MPRTSRVLAAVATAAATVWLLTVVVPWPGVVRAAAVVQTSPHAVIRGEVSGFVSEVLVRNDQPVQAGQALIHVKNEELAVELSDLKLEIKEAKLLRDQLRQNKEVAAVQIQSQYLAALQKRLTEKQLEFAKLTIVTPIRGRVIRRDLESLLGTYVEPGTELLTIAGPNLELALSISEDDFELFSCRIGEPVQVRFQSGMQTQSGRVKLVRPHASHQLPTLALAAVAGGPLPVQPVNMSNARSAQANENDSYEFISPRFEGTAQLESRPGVPIATGQVASVWFRSHHETVGQHLYGGISRWIRDRIKTAQDASMLEPTTTRR